MVVNGPSSKLLPPATMASFGTIHTLTQLVHPNTRRAGHPYPNHRRDSTNRCLPRQCLAAAAIAGLKLTIPPDFQYGVTNKTPEYLSKFPLGRIPSFEGSDGFLLTESNAIASYLADSAPDPAIRAQLFGGDAKQRALVQSWVFFSETNLQPTLSQLSRWRLGLPNQVFNQDVEEKATAELERWLGHLEGELKGKKWLVEGTGEGPSLADTTVAAALFFGHLAYIDAEMRGRYPEVYRWYEDVKKVPELEELYGGPMVEVRKTP